MREKALSAQLTPSTTSFAANLIKHVYKGYDGEVIKDETPTPAEWSSNGAIGASRVLAAVDLATNENDSLKSFLLASTKREKLELESS